MDGKSRASNFKRVGESKRVLGQSDNLPYICRSISRNTGCKRKDIYNIEKNHLMMIGTLYNGFLKENAMCTACFLPI